MVYGASVKWLLISSCVSIIKKVVFFSNCKKFPQAYEQLGSDCLLTKKKYFFFHRAKCLQILNIIMQIHRIIFFHFWNYNWIERTAKKNWCLMVCETLVDIPFTLLKVFTLYIYQIYVYSNGWMIYHMCKL